MHKVRCVLTFVVLVGFAGCGPQGIPVHPVRGQVLFQGEPTAGALVVFNPVDGEHDLVPRGYVAEDGSFLLTTKTKDDGAPEGDYVVTISWREQEDEDEAAGPNKLPRKYAVPEQSDLRVRIVPGENEILPFELIP